MKDIFYILDRLTYEKSDMRVVEKSDMRVVENNGIWLGGVHVVFLMQEKN